MFDIFYFGNKPDLFPFEKFAPTLESAASQSRTEYFWYIYGGNDYQGFDFRVTILPWEKEHVYVFGSQWQKDAGVYLAHREYASKRIYNFKDTQRVVRKPDSANWYIPHNFSGVDTSWHPDPHAPSYVYHFPSQHQSASGVTYTVPGATKIKLCDDFVVGTKEDMRLWCVPEHIDHRSVNFEWTPNALDEPYIYHFPSQHQSASGVTYTVPGATKIKLCDDFCVKALPDLSRWTVPEDVDATKIDFSWHPSALDPAFNYHFPSEWQTTSGLIYSVPGATEIRLEDEVPSTAPRITKTVDIFFINKMNQQASVRFERLKERYPNIQTVRFANSMLDTIKRCVNRSSTSKFWIISSENVYDDFDFSWQPQVWQRYMTHVFGSKWQKWSDTYLITKSEFERNCKWAKSLTEFPNLNFVDDQAVVIPSDLYDVYYISHNNFDPGFDELKEKFPDIKVTRFVDNYLDTLKRVMTTATTEYVWVISSLCAYDKFDFSWQPEPWQADMLHVFPSNDQKFGDTFFIPVNKFKEHMVDLEMLDWFNTVNYCNDQVVRRATMDMVQYSGDSLIEAVKTHKFTQPYAAFSNNGSFPAYTPSIWRKKDRSVHTFTRSGSICVVPRDVQSDLSSQMYDYPYILKHRERFIAEKPLDVIYISNGEPDAELWYEHLCKLVTGVKRVKNVNGRMAAYKAAAELSETPWFFAVFAKLEIVDNFDWAWQPDYLQQPKHYIFNSRNPLNGLEYGHQGMIAYNKKLVLDTVDSGLDFTLSKAHESVPMLSGIAHFNQSPWMTWRTAFREVVKLRHFMEVSPTVETKYRLDIWMTHAEGEHAEWCLRGAADALEFYAACNGEEGQLMLSYEWEFLQKYFSEKYS